MLCLTALALLLVPFKQARQGAKYIFLPSLIPEDDFNATCNFLSSGFLELSCFMLQSLLELGA